MGATELATVLAATLDGVPEDFFRFAFPADPDSNLIAVAAGAGAGALLDFADVRRA